MDPVQLACVKHAASVRPEPGSNPQIKLYTMRSPALLSILMFDSKLLKTGDPFRSLTSVFLKSQSVLTLMFSHNHLN